MGRRETPPPEGRFIGAGAVFALVLSAPAIVLLLIHRSPWLGIGLLPLAFYALHKIYGLLLLLAAWFRWRNTPVRGVLVYSDSPNWKLYIESSWFPALADRVAILNWSQSKSWDKSLSVRLFWFFCAGRWWFYENVQHNINPALILLRGLRYPRVYRYYQAFRDMKHGHPEALRRLEDRMFADIGES